MADGRPAPDQEALSKIDTTVPHSARIWNYWMGGKDNYEVDRIAGDVDDSRENRSVLIPGLLVDRIVVLAAQPVIPDAGGVRDGGIDLR